MFSKRFFKSLLVMGLFLVAQGCGNITEDGSNIEATGNTNGKGDVNQNSNLFQLAKNKVQLDLAFADDGNSLITLINKSKIEIVYRAGEPFYLEKFDVQSQNWEIAASLEGGSRAYPLPGSLRFDNGLQINESGLYRAVLLVGFQCDEFLSMGDCREEDVLYSNEVRYVTLAEKNENNIQVVKSKIDLDLTITANGQARVYIWNDNNVRVDYRASEPIYLEKYNEQKQEWEIAVTVDGGSRAYPLPATLTVENGLQVTNAGLYRAVMLFGIQCDEFLAIGDCADSDVLVSNNVLFQ